MRDVDTVEQLDTAINLSKPGLFHIDQIERDPLPSGHTSRYLGTAIKHPTSSVKLGIYPWK